MSSLDAAAVAAVDTSGLAGDILAMPEHIEDAMWRAESAMLTPSTAENLVVCGMGGSAIGAELAAAVLSGSVSKQIFISRGYSLPPWVGEGSAVLLSSYSGSTEETLACYEQARESGAAIYVVSSGGPISESAHADGHPLIGLPGILQPRAAVAYGVVAAIEIAIATGIADKSVRADLTAAAARLRGLTVEWGPDSADDSLAKRLARDAQGKLVNVYGADLTDPVAYRWACQINENAKLPAVSHSLPEANHNEICGWDGAGEIVSQIAWFLGDVAQRDRIKQRVDLTIESIRERGAPAELIEPGGASRVERLFAQVLLGDLVSLYLAVLRGVDPTPVAPIEALKASLGRPAAA